jgi:hypothetical protein
MKNKNKLNNKNEREFMSTNSNSKCKILLCLALPLTLTTAFASDSSLRTDSTSIFNVPTPIVASDSRRQAADRLINNEIFRMALADTNTDYNLQASVKNGVVTMDIHSTNRLELQRMVNEMWQLRDVKQVKNESGVDMASTLAENFTIVR